MKKLLLLTFCLFSAKFGFAQNYLPMAVENAHWIMYSILDGTLQHHAISIQGDTTINGAIYKKIWRQKIQNDATLFSEFQPPYFVEGKMLVGAIRDNLSEEKSYYIPFTYLSDSCGLFQEILLHDFSIQVGDTIQGCLHHYPDFPVEAVSETSEFLWGENRKVINVNGCARMVAGIGTDLGPFWALYACFPPKNPTLLVDYCIGDDNLCGLQMVNNTLDRLSNWQINLSPNPVADLLTIQSPNLWFSQASLTIIDFSGKCVLEEKVEISFNTVQLSVNGLASGVYLLCLSNENSVAAHRFVKL